MKKINSSAIIENPVNLQKGSVQDQIEDRSSYLRSDEVITWTGSQIEFNSDIILEIINTSGGVIKTFTIASSQSPVALNNNESAYILVDRGTTAAATIIKSDTVAIPAHSNSEKDNFILFRRKDTVSSEKILHIPLHKQALDEGQSVRLGASGSGGGTGSLDTIASFKAASESTKAFLIKSIDDILPDFSGSDTLTATFSDSSTGNALFTNDDADKVYHLDSTTGSQYDAVGVNIDIPAYARGKNVGAQFKYRTKDTSGDSANADYMVWIFDKTNGVNTTTTSVGVQSAGTSLVVGTSTGMSVGDKIFIGETGGI